MARLLAAEMGTICCLSCQTFGVNKTHMRIAEFFVPLLLLVVACTSSTDGQSPVPEDAALSVALRGVWCASDDNGKTCWGYDHFVDEGLIEACGAFPEDGKTFLLKGRYELRGRESCLTITESNTPNSFPVGGKFCARVLRIDKRQHTFRNLETGTEHTSYRVPETSKRCPGGA